MVNKECKVRPETLNINSNEPSFFAYSILVNKCSDSCKNINDPSVKSCVPDVVKDMNFKVFNVISKINETKHLSWHETSTCKC